MKTGIKFRKQNGANSKSKSMGFNPRDSNWNRQYIQISLSLTEPAFEKLSAVTVDYLNDHPDERDNSCSNTADEKRMLL